MGDEGAHPQLGGQGQRPLIGALGVSTRGWIAPGVDFAEQAQGVRLVAALAMRPGETQRALGLSLGLVEATGQEVRFAQREPTECLEADHLRDQRLVQGSREDGARPPRARRARRPARGRRPSWGRRARASPPGRSPSPARADPGREPTDPGEGPGRRCRSWAHMRLLGWPAASAILRPSSPRSTAIRERSQLGVACGQEGPGLRSSRFAWPKRS